MNQIFPGIFKEGKNIFTVNLVPGTKVYGEKLVKKDKEYREWDAGRSKLCAAILNGLNEISIKEGSKILYLGASTGTTPSHISDVVGRKGMIYSVEFSERVFRNLMQLAEKRINIAPIFADARKIEDYSWIEEVDIVYIDIADPQEGEIAIRNANEFLKKDGILFVAVKSQSIDVTKKPEQVYKEEKNKIENAGYKLLQLIDLEPWQEKHAMIVAQK